MKFCFLGVNTSDLASKSIGLKKFAQITQKFVFMSSRTNKNFVCPSTQHIDVFDIHMSAYIVCDVLPVHPSICQACSSNFSDFWLEIKEAFCLEFIR